jgi:enoyl-CoA hydratase/carnithine racemase
MDFQYITFEKQDGVARLTLNRPPLNVFDIATMRVIDGLRGGDPPIRGLR